ncbi:MAG: galactose mutarotase [Planctomycetota bacterium]|jgi:aldose 1-epimerase|nr:galactose mutarotase [Planctomycetota bacterium]
MRQELFGILSDGGEADLFTLSSSVGITVRITNYGGRIVSLEAPDRSGRPEEIGIGFDNLAGYTGQRHYCGALVGRVANRIRNGRFTLLGKEYFLPLNEKGRVHLHGGIHGLSFRRWDATEEGGKLRLDILSRDGEEGYPGNLRATVWYALSERDLTIEYRAETDNSTIVNLTNHAFFNLNSFRRDILAHELRIDAESYLRVDGDLVPTGEVFPVAGTPLDFNTAKPIGQDIDKLPTGYDLAYVFPEGKKRTKWLAEVFDPDSGRVLSLATDQPSVQLYSGEYLDGTLSGGLHGAKYLRRYAFCLEAQKHPDAINHANLPSIVLNPGQIYRQNTVYRLEVR